MTTIEASVEAKPKDYHRARTIWWRLVWKECKQVAPLFVLIALLAAFGHIVIWMRNSLNAPNLEIHFLPYVLSTILLAVGIGPVLVSQEKEERTLFWLAGLPIPARWIVGSKVFVGIVAVLLMWLLSVILVMLFVQDFVGSGRRAGVSWLLLSPVQAYFLLAMSFCSAWIWRSAMTSLLMLIPMCTIPVVLTWFFTELEMQYTDGVSVLMLLVTMCIVMPTAWYFGRNVFLASAPRKRFETGSGSSIVPRFDHAAPRYTIGLKSALIWQFWRQNQIAIVSVLCFSTILLVPFWWMLNELSNANPRSWSSDRNNFLLMNLLVTLLLTVWLSASAFGSDQAFRRIQFLAERGVSPGTVWFTRLVFPVCIAFVVMMLIVMTHFVAKLAVPLPIIGTIGLALFGIVAGASWWGQVSQTRVLSLCGAPVAAMFFVFWYQLLVNVFDCSWWLVFAAMLISFVATRVMTRPWMDGTRTWSYYLKHFLFLVLAGMLPLMETAFIFWSYPGMSRSEYKSNLEAIATLQPPMNPIWISFDRSPFVSQVPSLEPAMTGSRSDGGGVTNAETIPTEPQGNALNNALTSGTNGGMSEDEQKRKALLALPPLRNIALDAIDLIEATLVSNSGPLRFTRELDFLMPELLLSEHRLRLDPSNENRERFRKVIKVFDMVAMQLRRSDVLSEQCLADSFESDLVGMLRSPFVKEQLQSDLYEQIVRRLADREGRRLARRRAVLLSWKQGDSRNSGKSFFVAQNAALNLGGYRVVDPQSLRNIKIVLLSRQRDLVVQKLLALVDAKGVEEAKIAFSDLTSALNRGNGNRVMSPSAQIPGSKWHGAWEQQADELAQQIGRE